MVLFAVDEFFKGVFIFILLLRAFFKQALCERRGIEGLQIVQPLADADEFHGDLQVVFDREHHAAAGGAVQLGEHDAGKLGNAGEFARLVHGVLPGDRVQHQKHLAVRVRQLFIHHAEDLGELFHQMLFVVQTSGGIEDDDIAVAGDACLNGIVHHGGGVRPLFVLHDIHPGALRPYVELVDGGRTEGIRRAQYHLFALRFVHGGELADGGGLARAVHADHQDDRGDRDQPHILAAVEQVGDDVFELLFDFGSLFDLFALHALFELFHHLHGGVHAHVAHHEDLFQLGIEIFFKGIERIEHIVDGAGHFVSGFG